MKLCIECGCTEEEGIKEPCLKGREHKFKSTEERGGMPRKHKERVH